MRSLLAPKKEESKGPSSPALKKRSELTVRERKFASGVINGLTPTEAMRQAGYAETTALKKQSEKLEKVGRYIAELMDERGLSNDKLLDVLEEGLRATKVISANMVSIGSDESPEGPDVIRVISVEDYATRHRYLETGLRLRGYLNRTDRPISNPEGSKVFDFTTIDGKTRGLPNDDGR